MEVLVQPIRQSKTELVQQYREILSSGPGLRIVSVTAAVAEEAASLRATYGLRTPDAIQVATAVHFGAVAFVTNDLTFSRLRLPGLEIIVLDHLEPE